MGAYTSPYEVTTVARLQPHATGSTADGSTPRHSREVGPKQGSGCRPVARAHILTVPTHARSGHRLQHPGREHAESEKSVRSNCRALGMRAPSWPFSIRGRPEPIENADGALDRRVAPRPR